MLGSAGFRTFAFSFVLGAGLIFPLRGRARPSPDVYTACSGAEPLVDDGYGHVDPVGRARGLADLSAEEVEVEIGHHLRGRPSMVVILGISLGRGGRDRDAVGRVMRSL